MPFLAGAIAPLTEAHKRPAFRRESFFLGAWNRLLQLVAMFGPGQTSLRILLNRWRGVKIGKSVHIGAAVMIETARPEWVSIGNNVIVGMRSTIIAHFELNSTPENAPPGHISVRIEDDVFIGPGSIILPNVTIGHGAVVTAGSVVTRSVPPLTMVQGNPARPMAKCEIPLTFGATFREFIMRIKPIRPDQNADRRRQGRDLVESATIVGPRK